MRRTLLALSVLAALGGAIAADAASPLNSYTASLKFSPGRSGSTRKPIGVTVTTEFTASGIGGNRSAPVTDIKATIYGLISYGQFFPTCSFNKIASAKNDNVCPPGAMIASGSVTADVGPTDDQSSGASGQLSCDPLLHVWNAGLGKLVFFFVEDASHQCANGAITTGSVPPFKGTGTLQSIGPPTNSIGKWLVLDVPVPPYVDFPIAGLEASLQSVHLVFRHAPRRSGHGSTYYYVASLGCQHGRRPWTVAFTAQEPGGQPVTQTTSGGQACS